MKENGNVRAKISEDAHKPIFHVKEVRIKIVFNYKIVNLRNLAFFQKYFCIKKFEQVFFSFFKNLWHVNMI